MRGGGRYTQAGGAILAIAIIAGAVAGTIAGQSTIGLLVGTAVGVLLAILIWLNDRRKG
jgi:fucose permease